MRGDLQDKKSQRYLERQRLQKIALAIMQDVKDNNFYGSEAKENVRKIFNNNGLEYIGIGSTRAVAGLDEHRVVKFALWENYKQINLDEVGIFLSFNEPSFAKVFDFEASGLFLIAERCIPVNGEASNMGDIPVPYEICELIDDMCSFNFGKRKDGSWVVLDYVC